MESNLALKCLLDVAAHNKLISVWHKTKRPVDYKLEQQMKVLEAG